MAKFHSKSYDPSARNVWYRLLQRKLSDRATLSQTLGFVDSDLCFLCNQWETAERMLFLYLHKKDIWLTILDTYLLNFRSFTLRWLYHDMSMIALDSYLFRPSMPNISNSNLLSITMYHIWKAHWRQYFDSAPIRLTGVLPSIHKDLQMRNKHYCL
ncbi:hypothetical protein [Parasitella parasitica]|uniref:Reverse transcriptase zinc-binding domain-containing protein n=1 Tax=Parasitella parasitica TaxID=35722 RepID=A0A0B7NTB8_9FUNG|nr:hypothetical protein [Parasitella parasitica]